MNKKIIISIAVLPFIIMFSVLYLFHAGEEPGIDGSIKEPISKENIKENMFDAHPKIDAYKINIKGVISKNVFFATVGVNFDYKGQVDNKNQKMQAAVSLDIPLKSRESADLYIIEDASYIKQSGEWMKKELNESERSSIWDKNDFIKREIELINSSEIEFIGNEKTSGSDLLVIKITPDEESLKVYVKSWLERFSEISPGEYGNLLTVSGAEFKNVSVEYWIEKDTHLIKKEYFRADVVTDDDNYELKISVEFYDYNKPVNIIPPDENLF